MRGAAAIVLLAALASPSSAQDESSHDTLVVTKSYIPGYTGGGWRIVVQSRVDQIGVRQVIANRGNCSADGDSRALPVSLLFGQRWAGGFPCNPLELTIKTDRGDQIFEWSQ